MIKEEGSQHLQRSVRMPSQRQMISKPIRSGILIMRMEISVSYPIRPPKMDSSHYLIFMMKTDGWQEIKGELYSKNQTTEKVLRSYTYDAYGKVKEIKDYRNLLKNGDQAVQKVYIYDSFDRVKEMIYTDLETEKVMEIKTHRT